MYFAIKANWIALAVFLLLWIHGSILGLSDDEAYYWVLAQKPSLGYAFHPPAAAWLIAFFQAILGGLMGSNSAGLVRLPAALASGIIIGLCLWWLQVSGTPRLYWKRASLVLLSFSGFFSFSWMMVPDIPLFLGWTLLFICTWMICFSVPRNRHYWGIAGAMALVILSKYSGILAAISAILSFRFWAPKSRRTKAISFLCFGGFLAFLPILIWNSKHEWASILYQIRDRHSGQSISFIRYLKFWAVEMALAGPIVIVYTWILLWKFFSKTIFYPGSFIAVWVIPPALVFCLQPLFSDFKPHWAFVVWWPVVIFLAYLSQGKDWRWIKIQVAYGLSLSVLILMSCHIPIVSWIAKQAEPSHFDSRIDVTNDLYGWSGLYSFMNTIPEVARSPLPVVGSRYQTAAQASFSLKGRFPVTFLPRDLKERDEWPDLNLSESEGPEWPRLKTSVYFVMDNRYDEEPKFPSSFCRKLGYFEKYRFTLLAKRIGIWRCEPTRSGQF